MKILIINGSPRREGNSNALAAEFARGAQEAGHEVMSFDAAHADIGACLGCNHCLSHKGECVQKDDFDTVRPLLLGADVIVFTTPVYFFGVSAQLKCLIDRMHALNVLGDRFHGRKGFVLITSQARPHEETVRSIDIMFSDICNYARWKDAGRLHATSVLNMGDVKGTDFLSQAYELGKSIC